MTIKRTLAIFATNFVENFADSYCSILRLQNLQRMGKPFNYFIIDELQVIISNIHLISIFY